MPARSLKCLCLCLAPLITFLIDQSVSRRPVSRRGTLSFATTSRHRFARRSHPRLSNHIQPRSIPYDEKTLFTPPDAQTVSPTRRTINLGQFDDSEVPQSLELEKDQAAKLWEEFIQSHDGEDVDSYPDCDEEDQPDSHTASSPSNSLTTSHPASASENNHQSISSDRQRSKPSKPKIDASKSREDDSTGKQVVEKKHGDSATQLNEVNSSKPGKDQEAAEAKKEQAAQSEKQQEADAAKKQSDNEAKKEQGAESRKEQEAAFHKEQEAASRKEQEAESKREEEAAETKKNADTEDNKAKKAKEGYTVTDLGKIPGTSVSIGTAHRAKDETYNSSPSSEEHTGDATFFTPDVGACGYPNTPDDYIVAVSHLLYDSFPSQAGNPNTNAICHKMIRATYKGKSVDVKVMDRCEGCDMYSLDFTETAFKKLGSTDEGRLHGMTWTFI